MSAMKLMTGPWDGRTANAAPTAAAITVNSTATGARRRHASGSVTSTNRPAAAARPDDTGWSPGNVLTHRSNSLSASRTAASSQSPHLASHPRTPMRITVRPGGGPAGPPQGDPPGLWVARAVYPGHRGIHPCS